jgi:hypothetical protein
VWKAWASAGAGAVSATGLAAGLLGATAWTSAIVTTAAETALAISVTRFLIGATESSSLFQWEPRRPR